MTDRQKIFSVIQAIPNLPFDKSRVVYGLTDRFNYKDDVYICVYNYKRTKLRDTGGPFQYTFTFDIHVLGVNLDVVEQAATMIDAAFDNQPVFDPAMLCSQESYELVTEQDYAAHAILSYEVAENV